MKAKTLSSELWGFLHDILANFYQYKNMYTDHPHAARLYVQTKVDQFSYNKGAANATTHDEYIQKIEWEPADQHEYITQLIEGNTNYHSIVSQISKHYSIDESQVETWIRRLVETIVFKEADMPGEERIVEYLSFFIADLEKNPLNWQVEIWVSGCWVNEETPIVINDELTLRQITGKDLESERPFELAWFNHAQMNYGTAIIDLHKRFKHQNEILDYIETLLSSLRLFRLGSVVYGKYVMLTDSILNFGGTISRNLTGTVFSYGVSLADKDGLASLTELIFSKNRTANIFGFEPDPTNPIGIALKQFNNALLKSDTDEERIASVVSCLEALYLKSLERAELSHRLCQRAAILLKQFGLKPKKVYEDLDRAYLIRSIYSHGSFVNPEEHKDIPALTRRVLDYARLSLLAFIQFIDKVEKESLINKLENSMLEEDALTALKKLISDSCKLYK